MAGPFGRLARYSTTLEPMNPAEVGFFAVVGALPIGLIAAGVVWWLARDKKPAPKEPETRGVDKPSLQPNPFGDSTNTTP